MGSELGEDDIMRYSKYDKQWKKDDVLYHSKRDWMVCLIIGLAPFSLLISFDSVLDSRI